MPGAPKGQKRMSDLLELGLQMGICHHVVTGSQTQVLLTPEPTLHALDLKLVSEFTTLTNLA